MARAGVRWAASDEGVLERSLGQPLRRDEAGVVHPLDVLYRPWVRRTAAGPVSLLFRDRALSDLIGFVYTSQDPEASAGRPAGAPAAGGGGLGAGEPAGLAGGALILDGENAWEYYRDGGRVFLRQLYRGLAEDPRLRAVTVTEALAAPRRQLPRVYAGSWIDADFNVWIGHADDRRAWDLLGEARDALERARGRGLARVLRDARERLRAACASDWFWWYGDDRTSDNDFEFDRLFRRHLQAVYQAVGEELPAALESTLITDAPRSLPRTRRPAGRWPGGGRRGQRRRRMGRRRFSRARGADGRGGRPRAVHFGSGQGWAACLVELSAPRAKCWPSEMELAFRQPADLRYRLALEDGAVVVRREQRGAEGGPGRRLLPRRRRHRGRDLDSRPSCTGRGAPAFQVVTRPRAGWSASATPRPCPCPSTWRRFALDRRRHRHRLRSRIRHRTSAPVFDCLGLAFTGKGDRITARLAFASACTRSRAATTRAPGSARNTAAIAAAALCATIPSWGRS